MAIFVDTGPFVAARNKSDSNHARARLLIENALRGEYGAIFTSDYIIDEAITTSLARTHNHLIALNTGRFIIESPRIERLYTGADEFLLAWRKFQELRRRPMSFTDCVSLSHMRKRDIDRIMSFDSEFDALVVRVH